MKYGIVLAIISMVVLSGCQLDSAGSPTLNSGALITEAAILDSVCPVIKVIDSNPKLTVKQKAAVDTMMVPCGLPPTGVTSGLMDIMQAVAILQPFLK
jgi:hypothetical protein